MRGCPPGAVPRHAVRWRRSSSISVAILASVVVAASGASGPVPPVVAVALAPVAAVALVLFVVVERRHRAPLLPPELLRAPELRGALSLAAIGYLVAFAVPLAVSLWLQDERGVSASGAAARLIGAPLATLVAALNAGTLARRWPRERLVMAGFVLFVAGAGLVMAAILDGGTSWSTAGAVLGLVLVGAGNGVFLTPDTALVVSCAPAHARGVVNSLRSTAQNAGSLFGPVTVFAALGAARHLHLSHGGFALAAGALGAASLGSLALARRLDRAAGPRQEVEVVRPRRTVSSS